MVWDRSAHSSNRRTSTVDLAYSCRIALSSAVRACWFLQHLVRIASRRKGGKAVARPSLFRIAPKPPPPKNYWSFYIASLLLSSNSAHGAQVVLLLKIVPSIASFVVRPHRTLMEFCRWLDTACTRAKSAGLLKLVGSSFGSGAFCAWPAATR